MKAHLIGAGIGSLAAAAFMIRDGGVPGRDITIYDSSSILGGSLDGAVLPDGSYSLRGGRMLTFEHYECTWDLLRTIPSLEHPGQSVRQETEAFNAEYPANSRARLVDKNRHKVDVTTMRFSMADRRELVALVEASEARLERAGSPTGCRRLSSRAISGFCGRRPLLSSHGIAPSSSSAICTAS